MSLTVSVFWFIEIKVSFTIMWSFQAFIAAWNEACGSSGTVTLLVPEGKYLVGPIKFTGPCENVSSLIIHVKVNI